MFYALTYYIQGLYEVYTLGLNPELQHEFISIYKCSFTELAELLALAVSHLLRLIKHNSRVNETYQEDWTLPTWYYHICSVLFLPVVLTFLFQTKILYNKRCCTELFFFGRAAHYRHRWSRKNNCKNLEN